MGGFAVSGTGSLRMNGETVRTPKEGWAIGHDDIGSEGSERALREQNRTVSRSAGCQASSGHRDK